MSSQLLAESEIVIIDDVLTNLLIISSYLKVVGFSRVHVFSDSTEGLEWLLNNKWDLALLDLNMPFPNGFDILEQLQERDRAEQPIIIVTALNDPASRRKGLEKGANEFVSKPMDFPELLLRVQGCLKLSDASRKLRSNNIELARQVEERTEQLQNSYKAVISSLSKAASYRDEETGSHIRRIGQSAAIVANALNMPSPWCDLIRLAAPMHDVGKIGVDDCILRKPGALTDEERNAMQQHTRIGYEILSNSNGAAVTEMAAEIALSHHERWDGHGYPDGLKGESIPLSARIVAICDVYDALRMNRPYKKAWAKERAQSYIFDQSGKHFDPRIADVFCSLFDEIEELRDADELPGL
ncbi:response regulator [Pseudomonas sp. P7]|uniref:HD domain-containing phosphohydrolase n=1 Tax=Pseudomonas TaxID=286 RepID=UPI0015EC9F67|nr:MULTISPECIES: HD domain-containing phosphohydrolase [Pseudomonas]MBA2922990.1 response regulator [Pseudomonas sivasensis]MCK6191148.1 response regulator [Pseudomonas sp. EYE_354]